MHSTVNSIDSQPQNCLKKMIALEGFIIIYNIIEGLLCVWAGIHSGSSSLEVFGIDSFIESVSACIIIWRSKKSMIDKNQKATIEFERKSQKYIAYSFFLFGIYIIWEAIEKIYLQEKPEPMLLGVIVALVSLFMMPFLALKKYQLGKQLCSKAIIADSKQTFICAALSGILFIGLFMNYAFEIGWVDPMASLAIAFYMLREGKELIDHENS